MTLPTELKKWMAFGSGIGIEITGPAGSESLHVAAVRVRPGSVRVLGELVIEDAGHNAAGVWGTDYAAFLRKHGLRGVAATVLLPRREVIIRQVSLPGVSGNDLASAVQFQMDGLHPYPEDQALSSWARIPGTPAVLVAITRRSVLERFTTLFAEAGIQVGSFTCSGAALYSARHLFGDGTSTEFIALQETNSGVEIYGESRARPIFSATLAADPERSLAMAASEMRFADAIAIGSGVLTFEQAMGMSPALPAAAAACSACPWQSLELNLLPAGQRVSSSRALWIPVAALSAIVLMLAGALGAFPQYERRRYLESLNAAIARVEPIANRADALDRRTAAARRNIVLVDQFRRSTKADMDVMAELTRILPPPTWVNLLDISGPQVTVAGAAAQAAGLLETIDRSPLFESSEFQSAPARSNNEETFRIRTKREAGR